MNTIPVTESTTLNSNSLDTYQQKSTLSLIADDSDTQEVTMPFSSFSKLRMYWAKLHMKVQSVYDRMIEREA